MEAAVATSTRSPLPSHLPTAGRPLLPSGLLARPRRGFASISATSAFGGGGGGGRMSGGGGGGGGGGGDESGAGAAAAAAAVAALGEAEAEQQADVGDSDAIVLHVGGMSCSGCAGKVKRILESQAEVAAATVDVESPWLLCGRHLKRRLPKIGRSNWPRNLQIISPLAGSSLICNLSMMKATLNKLILDFSSALCMSV